VQRNRNFICIGLCILAALTLLGLPGDRQKAVASHLRSSAWSTGQWIFSRVIRFARGEQRSQHLLTQNVALALENMRLRETAEENRRLRLALLFRQRNPAGDVIPAEVIGRDPDQMFDVLVINAGRDVGLQPDWPVVTMAGLVGHIKQVDQHSSVVRLIFDARVSAVVQRSRANGIVSPMKGNRFLLEYVDASNDIREGDLVVSSGMGGRYPKGITIGVITDVTMEEREPLFKQVMLESEVDFWGLEEVFVLKPGGDRKSGG
jgi:rod shape-determining protein MreC|tara:strand:+ start:121 stop:906 length:786 start_codon:yes stop_codon:yes gene_type:complete